MTASPDQPRAAVLSRADLICLGAAVVGAIGALGVGGAVGGVVAVVCGVLVPGYALVPPPRDGAGDRLLLPRAVVGCALLSLLFLLVFSTPLGVRAALAALLLVAGAVLALRRVLARRRAAEPAAPAASPAATAAVDQLRYDVVLDDGQVVHGEGRLMLGRLMLGRERGPGTAGRGVVARDGDLALVPVSDSSRLMSREHVVLDFTGEQPVVIDQGSLNGTTVTGPDGVARLCEPGVSVPLQPQDVVSFAERSLVLRRADDPGTTAGVGADVETL